jgi:chromate transporter
MAERSPAASEGRSAAALEVLVVFLKLGLVSFGGPVAHLGYFRAELVGRRRWLDEAAYADIVALCQFLPGPASSQVGLALGLMRAGVAGMACAWLGFTLPSAIVMILFGYGVTRFSGLAGSAALHGLKIVAAAVVAQAVWAMARSLAPDRVRASLAVAAAILALGLPATWGQLAAIALGGLLGWALLAGDPAASAALAPLAMSRRSAMAALALFFFLLAGLPAAASLGGGHAVALIDGFYRAGSLVFGGGHVVLPLLQAAVVAPGWVGDDAFLAGYGAAQALPGPLFAFAAFLGTVMDPAPHGWEGGLLCLVAIYLPSFLLIPGTLPFWSALRRSRAIGSALRGVNAAVVGLLLAALYQPVWTGAILAPADFLLALSAFLLLAAWRVPPWLVVILGALAASALARLA